MKIDIDGKIYEITIVYKKNKNMYLRVKEDLSILITAPLGMSLKRIEKFVLDNYDYVAKVIRKNEVRLEKKENKFLFLGNYYEVCYINKNSVELGDSRAFIGKNVNIDNWYRKQAKEIFSNIYDKCFDNFNIRREKPALKIRKMKGKWGVCNITNNIITLNLELIKYDVKYLEYVIYHELCHLKHPNHSKDFWNLVEEYVPNYKLLKKEMKNV